MKYLLIIILSSFVTLVCCTTKHAEQEAMTKQVITDTIYIVENGDEDFISFIKRFHSDTVFQKRRVADNIHGYNSAKDTVIYIDGEEDIIHDENYAWNRQEIAINLRAADYLVANTNSEYERSIFIESNNKVAERFGIPGSGIFTTYYFEKKNGKWFFTALDDVCI